MGRLQLACLFALIVGCSAFSAGDEGPKGTPDGGLEAGSTLDRDGGDQAKPTGNIALTSPPTAAQAASPNDAVITSPSIDVHNGTLLVVAIPWTYATLSGSGPPTMTVADTAANTWAQATSPVDNYQEANGTHCKSDAQIFYAANAKGGSDLVTVTTSQPGNTTFAFTVLEYSGIAKTDPLDAFAAGKAPPEGSNAITSNALVIKAPRDVIVGVFIDTLGSNEIQAAAGFTVRGSNPGISWMIADDLPGAGPGTRPASAMLPAGVSDVCWTVAAAAFRAE